MEQKEQPAEPIEDGRLKHVFEASFLDQVVARGFSGKVIAVWKDGKLRHFKLSSSLELGVSEKDDDFW